MKKMVSTLLGDLSFEVTTSSPPVRQLLSHQTIIGRFHNIELSSTPKKLSDQYVWVNKKTINDLGMPKMVVEWMA